MTVTISGSALSSIFLENLNKDGDQEGFLLGHVVSTVTDVISDANISNKKEETTTCVQSFLPCPSTFKFYDNVANVNERRMTSLLRDRRREIVGWYKFRRNSSFQLSLRERALHQNMSRILQEQAGVFVFFLITACDMPQSTLDHACYQVVNGAIRPVAVQIVNLGDTTQSQYKTRPTSAGRAKNAYQQVLEQYSPQFLSNDGSAQQVDGIREMNHALSRKLRTLYTDVSETEETIAVLAKEVKDIKLAIRERVEMRERLVAERLAEEQARDRRLEEERKEREEKEHLRRLLQERRERERLQAEANRLKKIEEAKKHEAKRKEEKRREEEAKKREDEAILKLVEDAKRREEIERRDAMIIQEQQNRLFEEAKRAKHDRTSPVDETRKDVERHREHRVAIESKMKEKEIQRMQDERRLEKELEERKRRERDEQKNVQSLDQNEEDLLGLYGAGSDPDSSLESGPSSSPLQRRVGQRKPQSSYSIPMQLDSNFLNTAPRPTNSRGAPSQSSSSTRGAPSHGNGSTRGAPSGASSTRGAASPSGGSSSSSRGPPSPVGVHRAAPAKREDPFQDLCQRARSDLEQRPQSRSQTLGRMRPASTMSDSPSKVLRSPSPTY